MNNKVREGFTLIEIVIAIAIVAGLTVMGFTAVRNYQARADKKSNVIVLHTVQQKINEFYQDTGNYPDTLQDLITQPSDATRFPNWSGPYYTDKVLPKDPWNHAYMYNVTPDAEHPYELYSKGDDGKKKIDVWTAR